MALAILSAVPAGCPIVLDGLAFGALPEAGALRCRTPLIALVHQPLALDPGLHITQADTFRETERAALAAAARVVVTSEATARIVMADYDVPSQRISVVRPGNDPVRPALGFVGLECGRDHTHGRPNIRTNQPLRGRERCTLPP